MRSAALRTCRQVCMNYACRTHLDENTSRYLQIIAFESCMMKNVETSLVSQSEVNGWCRSQSFDNVSIFLAYGIVQSSISVRILEQVQKKNPNLTHTNPLLIIIKVYALEHWRHIRIWEAFEHNWEIACWRPHATEYIGHGLYCQ